MLLLTEDRVHYAQSQALSVVTPQPLQRASPPADVAQTASVSETVWTCTHRSSVGREYIDELHFLHPVQRGQIVILQAMVNAAWGTSMEVGVRVDAEDPLTGVRTHTASAYATFVALDESGRPTAVPALAPESPDQVRRVVEAGERRDHRLRYRASRRA